ncbi:hypothetical protein GWI33_011998 [Rhynchophorus ferrugineus]|uniref:Uncharacterized protein n=1 Tax=Rhynchophorus ferrugineus TaxID=354439 RepID=A0A834J1H0_RHYFE|nr:hypothetical protein GWI33_011998 [Rhynchophorus ferrugineus]
MVRDPRSTASVPPRSGLFQLLLFHEPQNPDQAAVATVGGAHGERDEDGSITEPSGDRPCIRRPPRLQDTTTENRLGFDNHVQITAWPCHSRSVSLAGGHHSSLLGYGDDDYNPTLSSEAKPCR